VVSVLVPEWALCRQGQQIKIKKKRKKMKKNTKQGRTREEAQEEKEAKKKNIKGSSCSYYS